MCGTIAPLVTYVMFLTSLSGKMNSSSVLQKQFWKAEKNTRKLNVEK